MLICWMLCFAFSLMQLFADYKKAVVSPSKGKQKNTLPISLCACITLQSLTTLLEV